MYTGYANWGRFDSLKTLLPHASPFPRRALFPEHSSELNTTIEPGSSHIENACLITTFVKPYCRNRFLLPAIMDVAAQPEERSPEPAEVQHQNKEPST